MDNLSRYQRIERSSAFQFVNGYYKSVIEQLKEKKTRDNWRKTVLFVCVVTLAFDPLFFFIPVVDSHRFCSTLDKKLGVVVCVFRTFIDLFYVIHIIFHSITAPSSQENLSGENSEVIRKRILLFYFIVDVVSVLPIPQVVVLALFPRKRPAASLVTNEILKWVMLSQYIPRSIRIYPIFIEVTKESGTIVETKWIGAALNLFLYLLPSHVIGAFWYLNAIERKDGCWREACTKIPGCNLTNLYCTRGVGDNSRFLNTSCPLIDPDQITNSTVFNFGMYIDALKSRVIETRDLPRKFFYCYWWGLRHLSALGQNLETSNSVGEIYFAIIICVSGVLLFAVLIGNVQKYLQSITIRVDEMEEKKRDTEKWMLCRKLPEDLKQRIRRYEEHKWQETRSIEDEALLRSLPKYLRLETKYNLYLNRLNSVPFLNGMNDSWLLEALCHRVKSVFYLANSSIVKEREPVEEMLIVTKGRLESTSQTSEASKIFPSIDKFCGEVLLLWVLDPSSELPTYNRTVSTTSTEVEGFILMLDDLKFVAPHLRCHKDYIFDFFKATTSNMEETSESLGAEQIPQATQSNL